MYPLVTISIPLYKCEDFLKACLDSVRLQTYAHIEVTLINDQTPDNSVQIAEEFIQKHQLENWRIIHLAKNSGLSVVRNKGIDTALGKYIFFVDSDDQILPSTIEKMVAIAEKDSLDMVVGNVETIDAESGEVKNIFNITAKENIVKGNLSVLKSFVNRDYPVTSWNKLIRLDFIKENQLYFRNDLFAEDALHSFEVALKLESVGFLFLKTYKYFLHTSSIIHNRKRKNFLDWISIASVIESFLTRELDPRRKKIILIHLVDFKNMTLAMNWRAMKDETLWKESYRSYKKLAGLSWSDYTSNEIPVSIKKADLFNSLPTDLGFRFFKWRWER